MSRKDTVNSLFMGKLGAPNSAGGVEKNSERVRTGAVSAMQASLQEMSENSRTAARLQAQIATGTQIVELDPNDVGASPIVDRIPSTIDLEFEKLVESIREHGQQVPILVRPDLNEAGKYQIAYGRRRLRAAASLGIKVKAVVRTLTDDELVIAQGKENLDRQDLTFIEKARFAFRLEEAGFDRATIVSALSTDKADLSRYIAIVRRVPEWLILAIGPAPKAGRARWLSLVDGLDASPDAVSAIVESREFITKASDEKLGMLLRAVTKTTPVAKTRAAIWKTPAGEKAVKIEREATVTRVTFDEERVPAFGAFLTARLDDLYSEFLESHSGKSEA